MDSEAIQKKWDDKLEKAQSTILVEKILYNFLGNYGIILNELEDAIVDAGFTKEEVNTIVKRVCNAHPDFGVK